MPKRNARTAAVKAMRSNGSHLPDLPDEGDNQSTLTQEKTTTKESPFSIPLLPELVRTLTSASTDKLMSAILSVNKKVRLINHDSEAYTASYASLSHVMTTLTEHLTHNGLVISQFPCSVGPGLGVITRITHAPSGQFIEAPFFMPMPSLKGATATQKAGAAITYARRYAIVSALGIVADKDIDAAWGEDD